MTNTKSRPSPPTPLIPEFPTLEAKQIGRQEAGTWLLRRIDFAVGPGQRISLVGSSGSGKSLLLRTLSRLDPFHEGELLWNGQPIVGNRVPGFRRQVIYTQQRTSPVDGTVKQWLRQPFDLHIYQAQQFDHAAIVSRLKHFGRDETFLHKQHRDLSGGEMQIAALLRSMQFDPKILLLDEPTSALDEETTRQVENMIQEWVEAGNNPRSFVWVTHNTQQADRVANCVVRIDNGQIQAGSV